MPSAPRANGLYIAPLCAQHPSPDPPAATTAGCTWWRRRAVRQLWRDEV